MKVLITSRFKDEEIKSLESLGYEVVFKDERKLTFTDEIKDIDIMVGSFPFDKVDIDLFPNLKWVQLLTVGIDHVPVDKTLNRNIILTNNRGAYSIPISEWIVLKILEMLRNSKEFYEKQRNKIWKVDTSLLELYGKTVGFIGTGSIAKEAAKRLEPFGVDILGLNSSGKDVEHFHRCFGIDNLKEMVSKCDFIIITIPYTKATHHLIDVDVFSSMKDGTYLVNIARGSIIDETSLIKSLKSGKIRKAALDVFEEEPLPEDNPLWQLDNIIISPHNSWASEMFQRRRFKTTYNNLKNYINNEELFNVVDLKKGY